MAQAQMRTDMEALVARLIQAEQSLQDTRLQMAAAPKAAPRVDTGTIGKAPTLRGEHTDWLEWPFQLPYMGSANLKSIEALRRVRCSREITRLRGSQPSALRLGTAVQRNPIDDSKEHGSQPRS